jgi:hypothetical protein
METIGYGQIRGFGGKREAARVEKRGCRVEQGLGGGMRNENLRGHRIQAQDESLGGNECSREEARVWWR